MTVFSCLRSGRAKGSEDFSEGRVLPERMYWISFLCYGRRKPQKSGMAVIRTK